jgi:ribosomal protein S18 acetylase RimI-like enzyme
MHTSYEIREGNRADFESMALLLERIGAERAEQPLPTELTLPSDDLQEFHERSSLGKLWTRLAFKGDDLAGFAVVHPGELKKEHNLPARSLYLWLLMVDPEHRRNEIGRTLVEQALEYGRQSDRNTMYLHTHFDNLPAQSLYDSTGFDFRGSVRTSAGLIALRFAQDI